MPEESNKQVLESMLIVTERVLSDAAAESQGVVLESTAYSISLFMINAVSTQYAAAQIGNASVASTCTEILNAATTV